MECIGITIFSLFFPCIFHFHELCWLCQANTIQLHMQPKYGYARVALFLSVWYGNISLGPIHTYIQNVFIQTNALPISKPIARTTHTIGNYFVYGLYFVFFLLLYICWVCSLSIHSLWLLARLVFFLSLVLLLLLLLLIAAAAAFYNWLSQCESRTHKTQDVSLN